MRVINVAGIVLVFVALGALYLGHALWTLAQLMGAR